MKINLHRSISICLALLLLLSISSLILPQLNILDPAKATSDPSWLNGWTYRKSHVINPASGAGTNYQVEIRVHNSSGTDSGADVYLNGNSETDFGDIRFTRNDGATLLDYWIEGMSAVASEATVTKPVYGVWVASDGKVYAGTTDSVYKSIDGGQTWSSALKTISNSLEIPCVFVDSRDYIYFSPKNEGSLNASDSGLWRSTDGGRNWSRVLALTSIDEVWLAMDEDSAGRLFVGTYGNTARIYRSTDGGATFSQVYYDSGATHIHDLKVDKSDNYLYATVGDNPTYYTLRSTDYGNTWKKILTAMPQCVGIFCGNGYRLFGSDFSNGRIFRTTDDSTYSTVLNVGYSQPYFSWIRRNAVTGRIYAGMTCATTHSAGIYSSDDNGQTWSIYKDLGATQDWDGSDQASNFVNGVMYYALRQGGGFRNGKQFSEDSACVFLVEVADDLSSSTATIYVYYGKSDAGTTSNGAGTFLLFDDFNDASLGSVWSQWGTGGTVSESGTAVTITAKSGGNTKGILSSSTFGLNTRVRAKASSTISGADSSSEVGYRSSNGNERALSIRETESDTPYYFMETETGGKGTDANSDLARDNAGRIFDVMRISSGLNRMLIDSGHQTTSTTNIPTGNVPVNIFCWNGGSGGTAATVLDWVAVTKYVSPEPSHGSWGNEETSSTDLSRSAFSVVSNSTVSALFFNSTSKVLSFTASGPSGTHGYANVTIAKTLIANVSDVTVFLDGSQISYTYVSTNYYWVLQLAYHHSTHKIVISLSVSSLILPQLSFVVRADASSDPSWLNGWSYRKSHTINPSSGAATNYQVRITVRGGSGIDSGENVYLNGHSKTDFSDVRFTDSAGQTLLNYWMEGITPVRTETTLTKAINSVWIASDGAIYAGNAASVYRSNDGGQTWSSALKTISNSLEVASVFVDSRDNVYFSCSGASLSNADRGIWRSTDGGQSWSRVLALDAATDSNIWLGIDEDSAGRLFAGVYTDSETGRNARIYRSTDSGATWGSVYYDSTARHFHDLKIDKSTNYIYAAVGDVISPWNTEYILKSTDNGNTWNKILSALPQCLGICVTPTARLFTTDSTSVTGGIYRATDDSSAKKVFDTGSTDWIGTWIRRDSKTGNIYASLLNQVSGGSRIYVSTDDGQTWSLYKTLTASQGWDGSTQASNFLNGIMYYSVCSGEVMQNGIRLSDESECIFWVRVAGDLSSSSATVYVYYGKSDAATTSNGAGTFLLFDDFNDGSLSSMWTQWGTAGTVSELGTTVTTTASSGGNTKGILSTSAFGLNTRVRAKASSTIIGPDSSSEVGYRSSNGNERALAVRETDTPYYYLETKTGGSSTDANSDLARDNAGHIFDVMRVSSTSNKMFIDSAHQTASTTNIPTGNVPVNIFCWNGGSGGTAATVLDWVAVTKYVNPEPSHGSWGSEETQTSTSVMLDKTFVSEARADVGSTQKIGFHAGWSNNASSIVGGTVYVNGTGYVTNGTGWINLAVSSPTVMKNSWVVTGVNCNGVTAFSQTAANPSIVWDDIKIVDGGVAKGSVQLGDTTTVWFKAQYEYDSTVFKNTTGILYVNGSAMSWSTVNNRWEYSYATTALGSSALTITGAYDGLYQLTVINNQVGAKTVNVWYSPFSVVSNSTISALFFNSTSKVLSFTASGPSGTNGYANVTMAKTLIANISDVTVFLDGSQISYTYVSTNYYWVLQLTYHHSTHKIVINLSKLQTALNPDNRKWMFTLPKEIAIATISWQSRSQLQRSEEKSKKPRLQKLPP